MDQDAHMKRIIDNLSSDLNNLSSETKRKFAPVKEASEASLLKLRHVNSLRTNLYKTMCESSPEIIKPFLLGCDTKQPKIIQICLTSVQKVIEAKILNLNSASLLINTLWQLTDAGSEELKVLQTIILLVTTTDVVKHQFLAKTLSIGLRIATSKDQIVMNTATAMLSQMVTKVFERVIVENKLQTHTTSTSNLNSNNNNNNQTNKQIDIDKLKTLSKDPPEWMNESAQDAFMLLQDLHLLLNSDQPVWLLSITDINRPFGLELLKSILVRYPEIFFANPEMSFILKERICPLLIKLFSPSAKLKGQQNQNSPQTSPSSSSILSGLSNGDQKNFGIVSRLIRIVFVLIKNYFELLITESEIFLSLLAKFLEIDRPLWQKALAIEVFHKISIENSLIELIVLNYDMKQHPEKIFSLITNGIALFIQSLFLHAATSGVNGSQNNGQTQSSASVSQSQQSSNQSSSSQQQSSNNFAFQISSAQPSFIYKDTTIQLLFPYISGQVKSLYLDGWDKLDIPYIQDGYLLSIGFATLQELSRSVQVLIEKNISIYQQQQQQKSSTQANQTANATIALKRLNLDQEQIQSSNNLSECIQIMNSCCNSFLFVYNILLESSLDETITEQILKSIKTFIYMSSLLSMNAQRDAFVTSLCKAALPSNYAHNVLNLKSITDLNYLVQSQSSWNQNQQQQYQPIYSNNKQTVNKTHSYDDSIDRQIQVVAVGPALHLSGTNTTSLSSLNSNSTLQGMNSSVSPPGPSLSSANSNNTLYITSKNLLVMRSILNMSHVYSELIGSSWYIILNTMQHLTWTLGLKPTLGSNGQLKHLNSSILPAAPSSTGNNSASPQASESTINQNSSSSTSITSTSSMITTAIQTEIAFLCNMLSKLFESTKSISDSALKDIIEALLQLSIECGDQAYLRTEPCLFAVAKLYETSISNLNRFDLFWPQVTMHFLCACKHTNTKYREWCVDSICSMIRQTFNFKLNPNTTLNENEESQIVREKILHPLHELSAISFNDVRQKQIECTLSILRLMGQHLNSSWPVLLDIIGAVQREHSESLIRASFQCMQFVVTDFLSMIKANFFSLVINVVSKFGSQEQDLNISLTAIVLLWNISDFMFQNSETLNEELKNSESIQSIWMVLYSRLGQLCVDQRPAVRKSACQTLFCTIASHGSILSVDLHWKELVWKVLFPLLEQVRHNTSTASREREKIANHPTFMMHHSRDTAEKQWAETSVLTLAGVTRVFNSKCWILMKLPNDEFHKMWLFLLNIIETHALSHNSEIALSALRGFHELLGNQNYFSSASSFSGASNSAAQTVAAAAAAASIVNQPINTPSNTSPTTVPTSPSVNSSTSTSLVVKTFDIQQWLAAWKTWLEIGNNLLNTSCENGSIPPTTNGNFNNWPPPCQTFLTCYVDLVSVILEKLAPASKFTNKDFENLGQIIDKLLSIPVLNNDYYSLTHMQTDKTDGNLNPLQSSSLNIVRNFIKLFKTADASFQNTFISLVFHRLLSFVLYACYNSNPIPYNLMITTNQSSNGSSNNGDRIPGYNSSKQNDFVSINFVPFGEKALLILTNLYEETASHSSVIENFILKSIIQTFYVPLSLKYSCPNPSTWKLTIECLFKILKKAFPIVYKNKSSFETMWLDLAKTFEDFLFTKNIATNELPIETIQKDEIIDCQVIELIRDEILTHSNLVPQQFIQKILAILNKGSMYSSTFENFLDLDSTRKLREEFSKTCFETFLRFSFTNSNENTNGNNMQTSSDGHLTKMALSSMLNRCKEIIQRYAHDERLNGNIPLPRARTNEMIGVLKALCTLINALKKSPKDSIQASIWNQVIGLYPCLVECATSPSHPICTSVKDALHHYFSLLKAP